MQVASIKSHYYIVTFIDDYSRWASVYTLPDKASFSVTAAFEDYLLRVERLHGVNLKKIRTDGGTEFQGTMRIYLNARGIQHEQTTRYSPESNGVAERYNRTILEMARPMLFASNLPLQLWSEAISTAAFIRNRLPHSKTGVSPHFHWHGFKPSLSQLRVFGCVVHAQIPEETNRQKWDVRSEELYLVGYEGDVIFKCWKPLTNSIHRVRDALFDESKFYSPSTPVGNPEEAILPTILEIPELENFSIFAPTSDARALLPQVPTPSRQPLESSSPPRIDISPPPADPIDPEPEVEAIAPTLVDPPVTVPPIVPDTPVESQGRVGYDLRPRVNRRSFVGMIAGKFDSLVDSPPNTIAEALLRPDAQEWIDAVIRETESFHKNGVLSFGPLPYGKKAHGLRCIFRTKPTGDGDVLYKARIVAQGYTQVQGEDYDETYAPVCKPQTTRVLLALSAKREMTIHQMDVVTAFLHAPLTEENYCRQLPGLVDPEHPDWAYLVRQAVYGLKQAVLAWYQTLSGVFVGLKFEVFDSDLGAFYLCKDGVDIYILVYVDDMLIASQSPECIGWVKDKLSSKFEMKDLGHVKQFLGVEVNHHENGDISICQSQYIERILRRFDMSDCNPVHTPMLTKNELHKRKDDEPKGDATRYREIIGSVNHAAVYTRPDIAYAVSSLSKYLADASEIHMVAAKRILRYLRKTTHLSIRYPHLDNGEGFRGFADASYGQDPDDRKSTSGYTFFFNGGLVTWASKRQTTVAASTMEAEYISLNFASKEVQWLRKLSVDMRLPSSETAIQTLMLNSDSTSAIANVRSRAVNARNKHIDIQHHSIRSLQESGVIDIGYTPTSEMPADILTKALGREKHEEALKLLGMS
jgi:hypothetical protein